MMPRKDHETRGRSTEKYEALNAEVKKPQKIAAIELENWKA